ncbi:MAG: hypothetical protein JWQ13_3469 [Ramlibacter sp.]|jgi:hypothetical protein|nr:hypothetical protein [Ramlibacter sp.]
MGTNPLAPAGAAGAGTAFATSHAMEAAVQTADELESIGEEVRRGDTRLNLNFRIVAGCDGRLLVVVGNRTAAAAYRLEPGWQARFRQNLASGLFG